MTISFLKSAAVMALLSTMAFAAPMTTEVEAVRVDSNPVDVVIEDVQAWLSTASAGDSFVSGTSSFTALNSTLSSPDDTDLDKRQQCYTNYYLQTNVDRTGTWWGSWYKLKCFPGTLSSAGGSVAISYSKTVTWTVNAGFNTGGAQSAVNAINGNAGLNFGFSWAQSKTNSETYTCNVNAYDKVSLWRQDQFGWSDTAQRDCYYSTCGGSTSCGSWKFGHVDWALSGVCLSHFRKMIEADSSLIEQRLSAWLLDGL
jgi:hypothetical protein